MNIREILNRKLILTVIISYIVSIVSLLSIINYSQSLIVHDQYVPIPIGRYQTLVFLSKPFALIIPFVMGFTVIGSYLLSKAWGNQVVITTTIPQGEPMIRKTEVNFASDDEKKLFKLIVDGKDDVYQNELVKKSGFKPYTVSRILSRFEAYGIIRREKSGITNKLVLTIDSTNIQ